MAGFDRALRRHEDPGKRHDKEWDHRNPVTPLNLNKIISRFHPSDIDHKGQQQCGDRRRTKKNSSLPYRWPPCGVSHMDCDPPNQKEMQQRTNRARLCQEFQAHQSTDDRSRWLVPDQGRCCSTHGKSFEEILKGTAIAQSD